ncbi:hypothetical protein GCM10027269_07310 [Kribbella endophytica]
MLDEVGEEGQQLVVGLLTGGRYDGCREHRSGRGGVQLGRDAEDRADQREGQRQREVLDQVDSGLGVERRQQVVDGLLDERFQGRDPARQERGVDEPARPGVLRCIGVYEVLVEPGRTGAVARDVVGVLAQSLAGQQSPYVVVPGDVPDGPAAALALS